MKAAHEQLSQQGEWIMAARGLVTERLEKHKEKKHGIPCILCPRPDTFTDMRPLLEIQAIKCIWLFDFLGGHEALIEIIIE